jgi:hypothetical protein
VRSIPKTFNRAGEKFTQTPRVLDVDNKKYAAIKAEPMLIVEDVKEDKKSDK